MTVSIRRMLGGQGYKYLIDTIARGDGAGDRKSPLTRYYAETGTPPGRFLGAGLAGLAGGEGLAEGSRCDEEKLFRMLVELADPATGNPLGARPRDKSVAGFDLTFSVPKSISAAWAVADIGTQAIIYEAHQEAIRRAISYAETHIFSSRSGTDGIVHEPINGVVAAAFDHWDSRAGDPHMHTHVVIQNRVQTRDGKWRTLDSRGLFRRVVTLSELHEGILHDLVADRLGWGWDARPRRHSAVPRWDIAGVGEELIAEFSQRSAQIELQTNAAVARFRASHGREPTDVETLRMRQHATLENRPNKVHRSLEESTRDWRERARPFVGDDTVAWVASLAGRGELPPLRATDLADTILRDSAQAAIYTVAEKRATFTRANLLAEIHRQLHGVRFADPDDRIAVAERVANLAQGDLIDLTPPERHHVPARFRAEDGTSRFRGPGAAIYTTGMLLEAEERLLDGGRNTDAARVTVATVAHVADELLPGRDYRLSVDQAVACETIATSGRRIDVLIGPAGTGKSTTMAGLRAMWEAEHGAGSVRGLAPSAAAAERLADEIGIDTDNTAKFLTELRRQPEKTALATELYAQIAAGGTPEQLAQLDKQVPELMTDIDLWALKANQLVIIDEASLAGTFALDELATAAHAVGAKLLLVGDPAQLGSVAAGGAFDMLTRDRQDMRAELTDVRRFAADWEKAASVRLRVGDTSAITDYDDHERIHGGDCEAMLDALYTAWKRDIDDGHTSLMIGADRATVQDLNARAHAELVESGQVAATGIELEDGSFAAVGDTIITRQNDRRLSTGQRWVKNGDRWTVTATFKDGSLAVKRTGGGTEIVLPAPYVSRHVTLGYAVTAHGSQGATVDTAHAMLSPTTNREVLYVSATRGRNSNILYVETDYDVDPDTAHGHTRADQTAVDVLEKILGNSGVDRSAYRVAEEAEEEAQAIPRLAAEYATIAAEAEHHHWQAVLAQTPLTPGQLEATYTSDAYGALVTALRTADADGLPVARALPGLVSYREFDTADDPAKVLHWRINQWANSARKRGASRTATAGRIAGLITRATHTSAPDMHQALNERADAIEQRAIVVLDRALADRPAWIRALGDQPEDPRALQLWRQHATTVAAYVDLHGAARLDPETATSRNQYRDAQIAQGAAAAARRFTAPAEQDPTPTPAATHSPHIQIR